jgi:hypothetical protein
MSFRIIILSFLSLWGLTGCISSRLPDTLPGKPEIYYDNPSIEKLSIPLRDTHLFDCSPKRKVKNLWMMSRDVTFGNYYSEYHIHPVLTQDHMSDYWTHETVYEGSFFTQFFPEQPAIVNGEGVSFGGIFWPLELMTVDSPNSNLLVYYNKLAIIYISPIMGHLFPLAVGNVLRFRFVRLHERRINGANRFTRERGIMEYRVVKVRHGFAASKPPVPGDIYTIIVSEATNRHHAPYITDIYDYAPALGWYITDQYFDRNNRLMAVYRLRKWN